ncbi:translocation/assembly module TamB domain-containing protein [Rhodoferax sp.]|uniref:translocation/assembly module TamB domain-containing protein n=1 Tax=Rhodoferax sp. TaxID=50421 RepID=UPI00260D4A05|nr:translocation/assembly module TamB domain-containing protein [Rhodoferax sp.]MDD2926525.1 translocation/assembly module TamB domain-containing protein [Rhodoferax sp.]
MRRIGLITLATLLLVLSALAGSLWLWSGSATSLATVLQQVPRLLPAGDSLEVRAVTGSLRQGGHVGWLRWRHGGLQVQAQDLQLSWQPAALLHGQLRVSQLHVKHLHIEDQGAPAPNGATSAPTSADLPFRVDAHVSADSVQWSSSTSQELSQLAFHYIFDSYSHNIYAGSAHFSSNKYAFSGQLQAAGSMALALQAKGVVSTPVPGRPRPLTVSTEASLTGALAGPQARLVLQAALTPVDPKPPGVAMQARLTAQLAPWQAQKIIDAQGQWQALNLAALWSQAPQTLLHGQATVRPDGPGWQASLQLGNTLSGPWDQQRLPLQKLDAQLAYRHGHWWLQSLQASGAGGSINASGQFNAAATDASAVSWQGQATVQGINPAAIDTRLASDRLSGTVNARQNQPASGIGFDLRLQSDSRRQPPAQATTRPPLQLRHLAAQGLWAAPQLTLHTLQLDAQEAQLQGQLSVQTVTLATQGQLDLSLPGLQATLNGQLSRTQGQGSLQVRMTDAAQASRWLTRWPQTASLLGDAQWRGMADLNAQWQGGWQDDAQALQLQAQLRAAQLHRTPPASGQPHAGVRGLQLELAGTPRHFSLNGRGQAVVDQQSLDWQTRASADRTPVGAWQASVQQLQLAWRQDSTQAPWRLQLADSGTPAPLTLNWLPGPLNTLTVSPGTAWLQGPLPGRASLSWQTLHWRQPARTQPPPHAAAQWQGQGRVEGLSLAWLEAFSGKSMADLGLSSDLLLAGHWQAAQTDSLHLSATLERSSGDLRLQTRDQVLPAKLREAWMQVNLDAGQLAASLRWDSEHAGKALLALSTQLQPQTGGWAWPAQAPVAGSLQLQLPPVDAWSALAPPGWRLRGTVDAHINLSGTQALPQWEGYLRARDLAVRSVVDGIDFSRGTLDARLHGQQLDIQTFTLQGASHTGNDGGQLGLTGSVFWLPGHGPASLRERLQMVLQAQISALRVSTRPDRRLVVSGQLSANLKQSTLTLRGALAADQALITLPDDSAPTLGQDVVVRQPEVHKTNASNTGTAANQPARVQPDVLIDLDLGPDFQLRGRGLEARLAGKLSLAAKGQTTPALNGSVRTVNGTYQAYGQRLLIERGVLRFTGPIDNPALTILALRPQLSQRVGVQVSGTALSPIVRLYAEPDLPDADKLAWLVLGRSASGGGAEAALMQQAALALLGGHGKSLSDSLSQALGLDELSFRSNAASDNNGSAGAASVTLGKRLSKDFYVAYESSLNGAMGVLSIFYDLSRRLTLRAQTGEQSAVDLIYTLRYD